MLVVQPTIMDKAFETNSSFHVKQDTTGKFQFPFFQEFFASIGKSSILGGGLSARVQISWHFLISWRPMSCAVRHLVTQLVYTMFITINHASFHLWLKKNLVKHKKVSKFFDHDYLQNFVSLFMISLTASFVKSSSHIFAGIYFIFLKQRPRLNLKSFQY